MTILEKEINVVPSLSPASAPRTFIVDGIVKTVIPGGAATLGEMNGRYYDIITPTMRQNNCSRLDLVFDSLPFLLRCKSTETKASNQGVS